MLPAVVAHSPIPPWPRLLHTTMNPIITLLSQKVGLSEEAVKSGLAIILGLLKEKAPGSDFEKLINMIPGANELLGSVPAPATTGGGLLGGILGAIGGQAGEAAKALSAFQEAGIPVDKITPLVRGLFDQIKASGGEELTGKLLESIPALKVILGGKQA